MPMVIKLMIISISELFTVEKMSERKIASEDEPGEKWDRCIADAIVKTGVSVCAISIREIVLLMIQLKVTDNLLLIQGLVLVLDWPFRCSCSNVSPNSHIQLVIINHFSTIIQVDRGR